MTGVAVDLHPFGTATLHESGAAPLPPQIRPLDRSWWVCGRVFTVDLAPGHNIWLHRAIYAAEPNDILVACANGGFEYGYWGDIMAHAAAERRLGGLVIDGCVRDSADLLRLGLPVFARGLCVRGTGKDAAQGGLQVPLTIGSTTVRPGDIVVGDADGVVVVPPAHLHDVAARAEQREQKEESVRARLAAGESTLDIYGLA
ncbi:RraA family protein [Streptomyces brasiliensis]|uniref:Putative 4-hydroxy-4-methyl-2-oxoglutarate aldolase n=1 Tax=Streptomyces brasiliensis TaxID=1954 RepID=A0A917L2M1_9ACTN|nr:RraA family protein [Streptomyces brasiliensis]GGJ39831.1 4-carboxy-4-hydroxy-2-oxoadipate aldolase [Streptomyces brasiliensis]